MSPALHTAMASNFNARSTALDVVQGLALQGQCAVVTGGASGLGLETSRALARILRALGMTHQTKTRAGHDPRSLSALRSDGP